VTEGVTIGFLCQFHRLQRSPEGCLTLRRAKGAGNAIGECKHGKRGCRVHRGPAAAVLPLLRLNNSHQSFFYDKRCLGTQDDLYTASSTASHYLVWNRSAERKQVPPHRHHRPQAHPSNARPAIMGHAELNGGR